MKKHASTNKTGLKKKKKKKNRRTVLVEQTKCYPAVSLKHSLEECSNKVIQLS